MSLQHSLFTIVLASSVASSAFANSASHPDVRINCPNVSALYRNKSTNRWESNSYHGYWKSYSASFLPRVSRFTGAQYIGNTEGNISCVYVGSGASSAFPVILHFGTLVHEPKSDHGLLKWQPLKSGWANCISTSPSDCAFAPLMKKKETKKTIYDSLETMKPTHDLANEAIKF